MSVCIQKKKMIVPDLLNNLPAFFPGVESVCSVEFMDNAPPWRNDRLWQAANNSLYYLIDRHQHQLDHVKQTSDSIKALYDSIDLTLERLCSATCIQCASPCCLVADVSYDFKDLLLIHLAGQKQPPAQPRSSANEICRYLGPEGCVIPRLERPWICTWYICAVQKEYMADQYEISSRNLLSDIEQVKILRKQMEDLFIDVISS